MHVSKVMKIKKRIRQKVMTHDGNALFASKPALTPRSSGGWRTEAICQSTTGRLGSAGCLRPHRAATAASEPAATATWLVAVAPLMPRPTAMSKRGT